MTYTPDSLIIPGTTIAVMSERDPAGIDWTKLGADVVIESTGKFRTRDAAAVHLKGGARKVLNPAPGKGVDLTVVLGVNDGDYDPQRHDVLSNASCTTNCVAPTSRLCLAGRSPPGRSTRRSPPQPPARWPHPAVQHRPDRLP